MTSECVKSLSESSERKREETRDAGQVGKTVGRRKRKPRLVIRTMPRHSTARTHRNGSRFDEIGDLAPSR